MIRRCYATRPTLNDNKMANNSVRGQNQHPLISSSFMAECQIYSVEMDDENTDEFNDDLLP